MGRIKNFKNPRVIKVSTTDNYQLILLFLPRGFPARWIGISLKNLNNKNILLNEKY